MGIRYRKSINIGGGLRINISKSGIGYSWGVKGYRITKTANGKIRQTISIPGTGISYSESFGKSKKSDSLPKEVAFASEFSEIKAINSADPEELNSEIYEELIHRIKKANWLFALSAALCTICWLFSLKSLEILFLIMSYYIAIKGVCYIEYDFDDEEREKWETVNAAWDKVLDSERMYQVMHIGKYKNTKIHAGIENAVEGTPAKCLATIPINLSTNVKAPVWQSKNGLMIILPDRIFIVDKKGKMGALKYSDVQIKMERRGLREDKAPPKDSSLIKYVWLYANKNGSGDKRYKNNHRVPVMSYGKISFASNSGLNIVLICSNIDAVDDLNMVLYGVHISD